MKKALFIALVLSLLSFAAYAQKAAVGKPADPTQGVRDAFERLVEGIKQVDADKVMNSYEKSPRLLIFNNNGSATLGWDTVKGMSNRHSPVSRTSRSTSRDCVSRCSAKQTPTLAVSGNKRRSSTASSRTRLAA